MLKKIGSNATVAGGVATGVVLFAGLFFAFVYKAPNGTSDVMPDAVPAQVVTAPATVTKPAPETQTAPKVAVTKAAPKVTKAAEGDVPDTNAAPKPAVTEAAPKVVKEKTNTAKQKPAPEVVVPAIDVVRVDETGSTVVAGKAAPNAKVTVMLDGKIVDVAQADATGAFVALLDLPPSDTPRELGLQVEDAAGVQVVSNDKVLVMPFKPKAKVAPKLVVAKADGAVEVIEPTPPPTSGAVALSSETPTTNDTPAPLASDVNATKTDVTTAAKATVVAKAVPLTLDTIVYDDLGDVVISGRGNAENSVRVYLDNKPADVQKVPDTGQWKITLSDVPDGIYDLRVDSINESGAVTGRVQSPFKREAPEAVEAASGKALASSVTIQPGYTLWAVAKNRYGSGVRYVQIFNANRDRIKDPNLIYPGQVFDLPN
ncbi:MAG: LysM peptidoglycan-binding domain-containing protein [Rhodobacterales bacterium]